MNEPFEVRCIGASVRAMMGSARRAGWTPSGIDLFADADAKQLGEVRRCDPERYPLSLWEQVEPNTSKPWLFTGGLENSPGVLATLAHTGPMLGGSLEAIRRLRDPIWIMERLRESGLPYLETTTEQPPIAKLSEWLIKPLASAGGHRIRFATPQMSNLAAGEIGRVYWQRFQPGLVISGLFLCGADEIKLIGVSRITSTNDPASEHPFRYNGNLGPIALESTRLDAMQTIGKRLLLPVGMRGLAGIDAVVQGGNVYPIEVNPRYTASVELYEWAHGNALLPAHRHAVETGELLDVVLKSNPPYIGKAIVYASRDLTIPENLPWSGWDASIDNGWRVPSVADLPHVGDSIEAGHPILTVFAQASDLFRCAAMLEAGEQAIHDWLNQPMGE